jgi:DNA-binding transcriptional MerR regulator
MKNSSSLPIGALSAQSGVKVPTIRFYEQIGLIPAPPRGENNRRSYGPEDARRLVFIRHARELGFEIEDIRALLALSSEPQASCASVDGIARQHLATIERRIAHLNALKRELEQMIEACCHAQVRQCRVIEVLSDHGQCLTDHKVPG